MNLEFSNGKCTAIFDATLKEVLTHDYQRNYIKIQILPEDLQLKFRVKVIFIKINDSWFFEKMYWTGNTPWLEPQLEQEKELDGTTWTVVCTSGISVIRKPISQDEIQLMLEILKGSVEHCYVHYLQIGRHGDKNRENLVNKIKLLPLIDRKIWNAEL